MIPAEAPQVQRAAVCEVCEWCEKAAVLVAVLGSDNDVQVCQECHDNPLIPTVSMSALADERPVYVITRGDLAEMAWRDVTDAEVEFITRALEDSPVRRAVGDIVGGVLGAHPAFAAADE
jgi:hypothetical protein